MFRIKICGITRSEDARLAWEAGADAIGLNFYPGSPRYVNPDEARRLLESVPSELQRVGVFVNADVDDICRTADRLRLNYAQLHGDEAVRELVKVAQQVPVVRAFRVRTGDAGRIAQWLDECRNQGKLPHGVMVDAYQAGQYGGTGAAVDWPQWSSLQDQLIRGFPPAPDDPSLLVRFILAGGLTPENVTLAMRRARPWGVDTASGVESAPGVKDAARLRAFVAAAREAMTDLDAAQGSPSDSL